ncbi:hypothetical protein PVT71_16075 [Salipiger sp. H15]|uniref:Uncharacterized protein n=1 Tax=Alloyangia sp. H15 TaxID=3029062 RepID=A0AAU8ANX9_9RHOB
MISADSTQTFAPRGQHGAGHGFFSRLTRMVAGAFAARDAFEQLSRESDASLRARNTTREGECARIARML